MVLSGKVEILKHTAIPASTGNPFDADSIADFQTGRLGACTELDDLADTFVTSNLTGLSWVWEHFPLNEISLRTNNGTHGISSYGIGHNSKVRMAYARMSPAQQNGQISKFFDDGKEPHTD